jgi:hypothetical protein
VILDTSGSSFTLQTNTMGAGLSVRNESEIPILVIASQLTPLHWGKCLPGETWNASNEQKMGKVSSIRSLEPFYSRVIICSLLESFDCALHVIENMFTALFRSGSQ